MERYPFNFNPSEPFVQQASDWIADVFYDILPESGFEVRDEQIFMAFQLERAYIEKKPIFAEAGVGTGKTLVYLLYAYCYARYTRKPAIIACADESLIEQLVKPEGDIAKLAKHLNINMDARLGKSADKYLCLKKLDAIDYEDDDIEIYDDIRNGLPDFVHSRTALQSFYPYGDRKQYSDLNDDQWNKVSWDVFQDCLVCDQRHRCGQTLSREHYRKSSDIIICSHDFYMEHVWTYEARKREGQLPLLPEHSSIVFDEGHLLENAAQKALTYKLNHSVFEEIILRLLKGEVREDLAVAVDEAILQSEMLFTMLNQNSQVVIGSDRKEILFHQELIDEVIQFKACIDLVEEALVFEAGLYTLDEYQLKIAEEHLEMIQLSLELFNSQQVISWLMEEREGTTLVIMPQTVEEVLQERVFSTKYPVIFSSATLSVNGSFEFVAESLGIDKYLSFSVASPFDYENQMEWFTPQLDGVDLDREKMQTTLHLLKQTEGRALILFNSREELARFKADIGAREEAESMTFWFEGDQEISKLISLFQNDEHSILCAVTLWEGLDIPGPSLSNVIIWSLPFPPQDPVFTAKRKASTDPFTDVDLPYMLLRLRQGIGRLIRTREDHGIVCILGQELHHDEQVKEPVQKLLNLFINK